MRSGGWNHRGTEARTMTPASVSVVTMVKADSPSARVTVGLWDYRKRRAHPGWLRLQCPDHLGWVS